MSRTANQKIDETKLILYNIIKAGNQLLSSEHKVFLFRIAERLSRAGSLRELRELRTEITIRFGGL